MKYYERNAVIDECIKLVRAFDRENHLRLKVRDMMRGTKTVPETPEGCLIWGMKQLKETPPVHITLEVIEPPKKIIVYSTSEGEHGRERSTEAGEEDERPIEGERV